MKALPAGHARYLAAVVGTCILWAGSPHHLRGQEPDPERVQIREAVQELNADRCFVGECEAVHARLADAFNALEPGDPARPEVLAYLIRAALRGNSDQVAAHLWLYFSEGRTVETLEHALNALVDPGDRFHDEAEELLVLVAASLSAQKYDPASFPGASMGDRLALVASRSDVGAGADELLRWHRDPEIWGPPARDTRLAGCAEEIPTGGSGIWDWWGQPDRNPAARDGLPKSEVGRALVAQIGAWYLGQGQLGRAESFLCTATLLDEDNIMTFAFRDLVWTWVDSGLVPPVLSAHKRFEHQFDDVDQDYLRPIEAAYNLHPWWTKKRYYVPGLTLIAGSVCRFVVKSCGAGGASGQVVVTLP